MILPFLIHMFLFIWFLYSQSESKHSRGSASSEARNGLRSEEVNVPFRTSSELCC